MGGALLVLFALCMGALLLTWVQSTYGSGCAMGMIVLLFLLLMAGCAAFVASCFMG